MDRLIAALERIAGALERQADADPLVALGAALADAPGSDPAPPVAGSVVTKLYVHPVEGWEIVACRDAAAPSGWRVLERRADG